VTQQSQTLPEQYRRPSWHEANQRVERMRFAREAEQDALLNGAARGTLPEMQRSRPASDNQLGQ